MEFGCRRNPGASSIGSQLQDGDCTDGWQNLTTQPSAPRPRPSAPRPRPSAPTPQSSAPQSPAISPHTPAISPHTPAISPHTPAISPHTPAVSLQAPEKTGTCYTDKQWKLESGEEERERTTKRSTQNAPSSRHTDK